MNRTIWTTWILTGLMAVVVLLAFLAPPDPMRALAFMVLGISFAVFEHFQLDRVEKRAKEDERVEALEKRFDQLESTINLKRGFAKK